MRGVQGGKWKHTDSSKPVLRANAFTSSKVSSMDGSFVPLFSQCHSKGPNERI